MENVLSSATVPSARTPHHNSAVCGVCEKHLNALLEAANNTVVSNAAQWHLFFSHDELWSPFSPKENPTEFQRPLKKIEPHCPLLSELVLHMII
jgi:hypothetical protein